MNHDPFKINEAILDLWRDLKAGEDYIHMLKIRNASLVSEKERIEPELEQRCRELNLSVAQQAIQLGQISELKAEVESVRQVAQDNKTETEATRIENARLKAEVERLRKAGDAMQKRLYVLENPTHPEVYLKLLSAWNAAKEGKQP